MKRNGTKCFVRQGTSIIKKAFLIIAAFGIIFSISVMTLVAEQADDTAQIKESFDISEEERKKVMAEDSDLVIRVYNVSLIRFYGVDTLEEFFEKGLLSSYYIIQTADGSYKSAAYIRGTNKLNFSDPYSSGVPFREEALKEMQTNAIIREKLGDVEIHASYFLTAETSHEGTAIYYKTDKGDYLYHQYFKGEESHRVENGYFYSVKEFGEHQQKEWIANLDTHYKTDKNNILVWLLPTVIGVLLLGALGIGGYFFLKKRRSTPTE